MKLVFKFLLPLMCLSSASFAQTEIKTAIGLAPFGKVGLTVEKPIIKQLTLEIGADYLGNFGILSPIYTGLGVDYKGYEFMAKTKYYILKDKTMEGVYAAPFFKFQKIHIVSESSKFDEYQYDYKFGIQPGYKFNFSNVILDSGIIAYYHNFKPATKNTDSIYEEISVNAPIVDRLIQLGIVAKLGFRF